MVWVVVFYCVADDLQADRVSEKVLEKASMGGRGTSLFSEEEEEEGAMWR